MNTRFSVMTKDLHEATKALKAVMPPKSRRALSIDTHVRMDTSGDTVTLSLFNLSAALRVSAEVGAKVDAAGSASVNLRDLCELLATYPANERADCAWDEAMARLTLQAGRTRVNFKAYPVSDFPMPMPAPDLLPVTVSRAEKPNEFGTVTLATERGALRYAAAEFDKLPILKATGAAFERTQLWFQTVIEFKTGEPARRFQKGWITPPKGRVTVTYCKAVAPLACESVDDALRAYGLCLSAYQAVEFHNGYALFRGDRRLEALFIRPTSTGCRLVWRGHDQDTLPVETLASLECPYRPSIALLMLGKSVERTARAA